MSRLRTASTTLLISLAVSAPVAAQSPLRAAPSSRGLSEVTLTMPRGSADSAVRVIRVDYGVPHLRGRALHTDSLVPYDRPWRTGANNATIVQTDVDLTLGGVDVPKGRYVVWTIPSRGAWKLMLQKDEGPAMMMRYDAAKDVARVDLRQRTLPAPIESLTMWLIPSRDSAGPQRGEWRIAWGSTEVATDWVVR